MKDLIILGVFSQIRDAIIMLKQWNADVEDIHDLEKSPEGMQRMAGNCMMIQAIGEGVRKIYKLGGESLLALRPEIPWKQVIGMRDRISHGYFDIDTDYIADIIDNDLDALLSAIDFIINEIKATPATNNY